MHVSRAPGLVEVGFIATDGRWSDLGVRRDVQLLHRVRHIPTPMLVVVEG